MTTLRRIKLSTAADLTEDSLKEAAALLLSDERFRNRPIPDRLQLFVHQYRLREAQELVAKLVNAYPVFDVMPSPNLVLEEHDWYIGAEDRPLVVDGSWTE